MALLDRLWDRLAPDPGPADFAGLVRRRTGNDALLAPADAAPEMRADLEAPVFPVPAARLRAIVDRVVLEEPGAARLSSAGDRPRYRVRSRLLRFPDLVDVAVVPRGEGGSTLLVYSRSLVGRKDFGVNRARLRRWLARITEEAGGAGG